MVMRTQPSQPGSLVDSVLGEVKNAKYDPRTFGYVGSAESSVYLCVARKDAAVKTFEDAFNKPVLLGGSSRGASTLDTALLLKNVLGVKFKMVKGYKGSHEVILAIERNEVQGVCGYAWSSLLATAGHLMRENKLNLLVQYAIDESVDATRLGVPQILAAARAAGVPGFQIFGEVPPTDSVELSTYVRNRGLPNVLDFPFQDAVAGYASGGSSALAISHRLEDDDYFRGADGRDPAPPTFLGNHDMGRAALMISQQGGGLSGDALLQRVLLGYDLLYLLRGAPGECAIARHAAAQDDGAVAGGVDGARQLGAQHVDDRGLEGRRQVGAVGEMCVERPLGERHRQIGKAVAQPVTGEGDRLRRIGVGLGHIERNPDDP